MATLAQILFQEYQRAKQTGDYNRFNALLRQNNISSFDPRIAEYGEQLSTQDPRIKDGLGDDYQINTLLREEGPSWGSAGIREYQASSAYGDPTGQFSVVSELPTRTVPQTLGQYALTAAAVPGAFGADVQAAAQLARAGISASQGNIADAITTAIPGVSHFVPGVGEYVNTFKDVTKYAKAASDIAKAIENKDIGKLVSLGGQYTDSEITKLIGRGISAVQSGNPMAIANALRGATEYFSTPDYQEMYNQPSYLPGYTDPDGFYVHPEQIERASLADYGVQDLGISPENWESYTKNLTGIGGMGGFTSTWQTVGSDRVMVQDDGSAIGINTETGDTYSLTQDEVTRLSDNGLLNSATSGYTGAVSGPGIDFTTSTSNAGGTTGSKGGTQQKQEDKKQTTTPPGLGFDPRLFAILGGMFGGDDEEKTPYQVADIDVESPFGKYV